MRGPAGEAHYTVTAMQILGPVRPVAASPAVTEMSPSESGPGERAGEPAPVEGRSRAQRVWERWAERVEGAAERVRERERSEARTVEAARRVVDSLLGGLPRAASDADTPARQLVHDGLATLLTDLVSAGASLREAWDDPAVVPLRESAEALRDLPAGRTHYTGVPLELIRLQATLLPPHTGPVVDDAFDGDSFADEDSANDPFADEPWTGGAWRGGVGSPPQTERPRGGRYPAGSAEESVNDSENVYASAYPTGRADDGRTGNVQDPPGWMEEPVAEEPAAEPGRLSAAVAEFESRLEPDARQPAPEVAPLRAEASALLGERPRPRAGYGPSAAEQRRLWQAMIGSVAWALSQGADAEGVATDLRAGFERLREFDDLAAWAEIQLEQVRERIDQARERLEQRRHDEPPTGAGPVRDGDDGPDRRQWQEQLHWREQLRRQEAEDLLGPLPPSVPGGVPERIRAAFHEGLTTMLTDLLLHGEDPLYAWTELSSVRQAAETVRLSSRHLRDATPETPFGRFPEPGRGAYSEDLYEAELPNYDHLRDPDGTRHSGGAPAYSEHPIEDQPPSYEDSQEQVDQELQPALPQQVAQMANLLAQIPRTEATALRTRLLPLVVPPEGLTPEELARRLPLHDIVLSALAYHAHLEGEDPGTVWERGQMTALLDRPGLDDILGPDARRHEVLDDTHHALRTMFAVARSYAEPTEAAPESGSGLADVDFVPLRSRSGTVVGVGFPLSEHERGVLLEAFRNRPETGDEFTVPLHHDHNGFSVRTGNGRLVTLDERAVVQLLSSIALPGETHWLQHSSLVFLSCRVSSPHHGNRVITLTELLRDTGFRGGVTGFDTRVEVRRDGTVRPLADGAEPEEGAVVFATPPNASAGALGLGSALSVNTGSGPGGSFDSSWSDDSSIASDEDSDALSIDSDAASEYSLSSSESSFAVDEARREEVKAELSGDLTFTVEADTPASADVDDRPALRRLANALLEAHTFQRADGLSVRVEIMGTPRDTRIFADLLRTELGDDPAQPLPEIALRTVTAETVTVEVTLGEVSEGSSYEPTTNSSGGISFDSGRESVDSSWEALHAGMPSLPVLKRPFYVYVTGRMGKFVVNGVRIDGATLARHVRNSPSFRMHAADDPSVPVVLVGADPTRPDLTFAAAQEFAKALRGDGPYRSVAAANDLVESDAGGTTVVRDGGIFGNVAEILPDDVQWAPLTDVDGRQFGMGFVHGTSYISNFSAQLENTTDHSLRSVIETSVDQNGKRHDEPATQAWADATDGARRRPVALHLDGEMGRFKIPLSNETDVFNTPEATAELIAKAGIFQAATAGAVRPPLLVFTYSNSTSETTTSDANRRLLSKLRALTGHWQSYDYAGFYRFSDAAMLQVPRGAEFRKGPPPSLAEIAHVASDEVFGFPVSGGTRAPADEQAVLDEFREAVRAGTADLAGPWGSKEPLVVSVDSPDGKFARIETRDGAVLELNGQELGEMLLADPDFVWQLRSEPERPVLLVARHGGSRVNFGRLGFDFAGALRAHRFYPDVYSTPGEARIEANRIVTSGEPGFVKVSELRAGDLKTDLLHNDDGEPVALFVRYPGDEADFAQAEAWAKNVTAGTLETYWSDTAAGRVNVPWDAGVLPMFLLHGGGKRGSRTVRNDGAAVELTPAELGRIVRNDEGLRKALNRSKRRPWTRPLVFAALDGETRGVEEFAQTLAAGGYSRLIHHPAGRVKLFESGGFATSGMGLKTQPVPSTVEERFISHAMANDALGVHGEFFPLTENDAQHMFLAARNNDPAGLRYYFREVADAATGSGTRFYEPVLSPWADSTVPVWFLDGHGSTEGLAFGMGTDRPLQFGDTVVRDGGDAARVIFGSKVFQDAGFDPTVRAVLGHCKSMVTVNATTMTPAEELKFARQWLTEGTGQVFGATEIVRVSTHQGFRAVVGTGEFVEALPAGRRVPSIPLADLAANRIDPVEVTFPTAAASIPKSSEALVREVARKVARAAAWRLRNTVGLPRVTITGWGKAGILGAKPARKRGLERAEALSKLFHVELRAESGVLRSLGLAIRPEDVLVEVIGSETTSGTGPTGRIDVTVPWHDLGEEAARPVSDTFVDADVPALNKAFALLAPDHATKAAATAVPDAGPVMDLLARALPEGGPVLSRPSPDLDAAVPAGPIVYLPSHPAASGGVLLSANAAEAQVWEQVYASLPVGPDIGARPFYVFATAHRQRFVVDGEVFDGASLVTLVRNAGSYQDMLVSDPDAEIVLVVSGTMEPATLWFEASRFAELMNSEETYWLVSAVYGMPVTDENGVPHLPFLSERVVVSSPRSRLRAKPLIDAYGRERGAAFFLDEHQAAAVSQVMRLATDVSSRAVGRLGFDASGKPMTVEEIQEWAPATTGDRTRPRFLFLENGEVGSPAFSVKDTQGHGSLLGPVEMAHSVAAGGFFSQAAGGVRPQLVLFTVARAPSAADQLNQRFLAALRRLAGPLHAFTTSGPFLTVGFGAYIHAMGSGFASHPLRASDVRIEQYGTVFAFPNDANPGQAVALRAFAAGLQAGTTPGTGPWGDRVPVFVLPDAYAKYAKIGTIDGMLSEVGGASAADILLELPGFRELVQDPKRPVVLLGYGTGSRVSHGGFGFDFAGALRKRKLFNDVFAPVSAVAVDAGGLHLPTDGGFARVSTLRAGDVRASTLAGADGMNFLRVVHWAGDQAVMERLATWAKNTTAANLRLVGPDGNPLPLPWAGGEPPVVVVAARNPQAGYLFVRADGEPVVLPAGALARALRDDRELRAMLGREAGPSGGKRPVLLIDQGTDRADLVAFADGMVPGGYRRAFYRITGPISLTPDGQLRVSGEIQAYLPEIPDPPAFAGHPLTNSRRGTFGEYFPSLDFDSATMELVGLHSETPKVHDYYTRITARVDQTGSVQQHHKRFRSPWIGRRTWTSIGHGTALGFSVSLKTGFEFVLGDVLMLAGDRMARVLYQSEIYRAVNPSPVSDLVLFQCSAHSGEAAPDGRTPAYLLRLAWEQGHGPVSVFAGTKPTGQLGLAELSVHGGDFVEVLSPGQVPPPPVEHPGPVYPVHPGGAGLQYDAGGRIEELPDDRETGDTAVGAKLVPPATDTRRSAPVSERGSFVDAERDQRDEVHTDLGRRRGFEAHGRPSGLEGPEARLEMRALVESLKTATGFQHADGLPVPTAAAGSVHGPTPSSVGAIGFDPAGTSHHASWEILHQAMPAEEPRKTFRVFVEGRDGGFLLDGTVVDGATLARHVRNSPEFRALAWSPRVPVTLIGADPANPEAAERAAREFAEALRGEGPFRTVRAVSHPLALDDTGRAVPVSGGRVFLAAEIRPDDVAWISLESADGRRIGMGFASEKRLAQDLRSRALLMNDHTLRATFESFGFGDDGFPRRKYTMQAWAPATDGSRTRPVALLLDGQEGVFDAPLTDGSVRDFGPDRMAELVHGSSMFGLMTGGLVRPPLLVLTESPRVKNANLGGSNARLLVRLRELAGPREAYDYAGRYKFTSSMMVNLVRGGRFTESGVPTWQDVSLLAEESAWVFPVAGGELESGVVQNLFDALDNGTATLNGPWGEEEPLVVVVDSPDGTYARITGKTGVVMELDGRKLGLLLLSDPLFRVALKTNQGRPVVLVARNAGARVNFGGLGFDLAGVLRANGFYSDVYAPPGNVGMEPDRTVADGEPGFVLVSELRAGDLRTQVLTNFEGQGVALFVRFPGDQFHFARAKQWASRATADRVREFLVDNGYQSPYAAKAPWHGLPVFLLTGAGPRGYHAVREDGAPQSLTPSALVKIVRADLDLQAMLLRGEGTAVDRSLVVAALNGVGAGLGEISSGLQRGGYSRIVYLPPGRIQLSSDGGITIDGDTFRAANPLAPKADSVLSYPMANDVLGVHGQFFPLDEIDAHYMFSPASRDSAVRQAYFFQETTEQDSGGAMVTRLTPYLSPWVGSRHRPWFLDGHGGSDLMSVSLKMDRPLHIGDKVTLTGRAGARIVHGSEIYRTAAPDALSPVVLGQCRMNAPVEGTGRNFARTFTVAWQELVGKPAAGFGATDVVRVTDTTGRRAVENSGLFTEARTDDRPAEPAIPLGDLAASTIAPMSIDFPDGGTLSDAGSHALRETARRVVRAAAWRERNGVALPEVTIRGFDGKDSAEAVAAAFKDAVNAEAVRMGGRGLPVDPANIVVRAVTAEDAQEKGLNAAAPRPVTIEIALEPAELGEKEIARTATDGSADAINALNKAFALLVPGQPAHNAAATGPVHTEKARGAGQVNNGLLDAPEALSYDQDADVSGDEAQPPPKKLKLSPRTIVFEGTPSAIGAVAFPADAAELKLWREIYHELPPLPVNGLRNPFYVFVTARDGGFDVDGRLVDGAELASYVRSNPEYRRALAAEPDLPVSVIGVDFALSGDSVRALREFADALRGDGPYREMFVADLPASQKPQHGGFRRISRPRLEDLKWTRLIDAHGRDYGVGFPTDEWSSEILEASARQATDPAQRVIAGRPEGDDASYGDRAEQWDETIADWAGATEDGRARPLHLLLTADGGVVVQFENRIELELTEDEVAELALATDVFARARAEQIRRPLIVAIAKTTGGPGTDDLAPALLSELKALSGPWQSYSFHGQVTLDEHVGFLTVPRGERFTETPLTLGDVDHVSFGPVFGFPTGFDRATAAGTLRRFAQAVAAGTAGLPGEWSDREPIFVSADGATGHATMGLPNGIHAEVEGGNLGRQLLSDPDFVHLLRSEPKRPIVLVSSHGAARKTFGGLGFDVAGALRAAGYFTDVYAPTAGAWIEPDGVTLQKGSEFELVSGWRAGDLMIGTLRSDDGSVVIKLLRSPDDGDLVERLRTWIRGASAGALAHFSDLHGQQRDAPWGAVDKLVFVVGRRGQDDTYSVLRHDRAAVEVSQETLGEVLRDDEGLRTDLGDSVLIPLLLVGVGGSPSSLGSFATAMADGGYARDMYRSLGDVSFEKPGTIIVDGTGFETHDTIPPARDRLATYPQVRSDGVVHGQFFPSKPLETPLITLHGIHHVGEKQRTYFRQLPGDGVGTVTQDLEVEAPWAGKDPWLINGHGSLHGLSFALITGRPHVRGDVIVLDESSAAQTFYAGEIFVKAGVGPDRPVVLGHCWSNGISPDQPVSTAFLIKQAWEQDFRPVTMYGSDTRVRLDTTGGLWSADGGRFAEVGTAPGAEPPIVGPATAGSGPILPLGGDGSSRDDGVGHGSNLAVGLAGVPDLLGQLSDQIAQLKRHLAALPPGLVPEIRARMEVWDRLQATLRVTEQQVTELVNRVAAARQLTAHLRDVRLKALAGILKAAAIEVADEENPLIFHPDGIPGGVSSRPDVRFGFEIEAQLMTGDFDQLVQGLGAKLESAGYLTWGNGRLFTEKRNTTTDAWWLKEEPAHEAGIEIVSRILRGDPGSWRELADVLEIIRTHGGGDAPDAGYTGGHVNFSFDQQLPLPVYGRLAQLNKAFESVLYRLGNHYGTAALQRKLWAVGPNPIPPPVDRLTTVGDVQGLSNGKYDALNFEAVLGKADDRLEFRFWAGSLDPAVWQIHAEISAAMVQAARDPSIHRRLDELMTEPRLLGHEPEPGTVEEDLGLLLDFLELLPLSPDAQKLIVGMFAWTVPWNFEGDNDHQLRAQMITSHGGMGWLYPTRGESVREAIRTLDRFPVYAGARILSATITPGQDTVEMWLGDPVAFEAFAKVVAVRDVLRAVHDVVPEDEDADPYLILAVHSGTRLGETIVQHLGQPVLVTNGRVRITEGGRLEAETGWIQLSKTEPTVVHTGLSDAQQAIESLRTLAEQAESDPEESDSGAARSMSSDGSSPSFSLTSSGPIPAEVSASVTEPSTAAALVPADQVAADDIEWATPKNAHGTENVMASLDAQSARELHRVLGWSTEHTERLLGLSSEDGNGVRRVSESKVDWPGDVSPLRLLLTAHDGRFRLPLGDGRHTLLTPEEAAEKVAASSTFHRLTADVVRPPLAVITRATTAQAGDRSLNEAFLAKLIELTGPWQSRHYIGEYGVDEFGVLVVDEPFTAGPPLTLADVRYSRSGSAFGFGGLPSYTDERDPVVVGSPGTGFSARLELPNGKITHVAGAELGRMLLEDEDFRRYLGEGRPVVLDTDAFDVRVNFGGVGFDFAGALREAKFFNDVHVRAGDGTLTLVSVPRAGDLRTVPITGPNGERIGEFVRFPGDGQALRRVRRWAEKFSGAFTVFLSAEGKYSSWPKRPVLLFARRSETGYLALRADGQELDLTSSVLARSLRDGQGLRDMLGTEGASLAGEETGIPVMLASLGGPVIGLAEFADGFVPAGYSRAFHGPRGELEFGQDGVLKLAGTGFERIAPIVPGPQHLVSYERANAKLGTSGRFFPSQDFDRARFSAQASHEEPVHRYFYYSVTEVPDGQGGTRKVSVPYLMPLKPDTGRMWTTAVHGNSGTGFDFSMLSGHRDVSGDRVRLAGAPSAAALHGGEMFRRAQPGERIQQVLLSCWADATPGPGGDSSALKLKKVWGQGDPLVAADNVVTLDLAGSRSVRAGGHFREVGSRAEPIPLSDLAAAHIPEAAAFGDGVNADVGRLARQVARAAAWRARNAAALPDVEIVGHGYDIEEGREMADEIAPAFRENYRLEQARLAELGLPAPSVEVRLAGAAYADLPDHLWEAEGAVRVELPVHELGEQALNTEDHLAITAAFSALAPDRAPSTPDARGGEPAPGPPSAEQAVELIRRSDLTGTLRAVVVDREEPSEERRYSWGGRGWTSALPPLPALLALPRWIHAVWVPGGLPTVEAVARFRDDLEHAVRVAGDRWHVVLWTTVTREKLVRALRPLTAVRHDVDDDDEPAEIADTYDWARNAGIALVNIQQGIEAAEFAGDSALPAASEDLAGAILSRFGGVYLPADHRVDDLEPAENVVRAAAAWAGHGGVLAMPQGHPAAWLHSLPRPEVEMPELCGFTPIGPATPAIPGPATPAIETGVPESETPAGSAGDSVADSSERVLQVLLDGLRDHPGHLDLAAVAALVEGAPDADEVWITVLAFLAADPELAAQIHTVTLQSVDEAGVPRRVVLPPLADELLHLSEEPPTSPEPGEFTYRAELTRPAWLPVSREAHPTTKEDHGHHD